jgi:hypothetical protein
MKKNIIENQFCLFDDTDPNIKEITELASGFYFGFRYKGVLELHDGMCYHVTEYIERDRKNANMILWDWNQTEGTLNPQKRLIAGRIRTPDGTILTSRHRHDHVAYHDTIADDLYFVDGGSDYIRTTINKIPAANLSVYSTDDFELIRENCFRGTFDENGNRIWKPISECSNEHLKNILTYNEEHDIDDIYYTWLINRELEYREDNNIVIADNWKG